MAGGPDNRLSGRSWVLARHCSPEARNSRMAAVVTTEPGLPATVYTVTPDTPVSDVAKLLVAQHVGDVIVVQEGKPVGILTDRDLVVRVMAAGSDPKTVKVRQVMSGPLITINAQEELGTAIALMGRYGIRRLPIVDESGCLVSILTMDEIIQLGLAGSPELTRIIQQQFHPDKRSDAPLPAATPPVRRAEPSRLDLRQPIVSVHRQTVIKPVHRYHHSRLDYARSWLFWNREWLQFTGLLVVLAVVATLLVYYIGIENIKWDRFAPRDFYTPHDEERQLHMERQRLYDQEREDKRREREDAAERRSRGRP